MGEDLLAPPLAAEVLITIAADGEARLFVDKPDCPEATERIVWGALTRILQFATQYHVQVVIQTPAGPIVLNDVVR